MCSCCKDKAFLQYKLGRLFDLVDVDKNGKFQRKDLTDWGKKAYQNLQELGNEVSDEQFKNMERIYASVYNRMTMFGFGGKNRKRFVGFMSVTTQLPLFSTIANRLLHKAFLVYDLEDAGSISREQFHVGVLKPIGISEEEAFKAFDIMDVDGNGKLDYKEFTNAIVSYLSDLEENKFSNSLGAINYNKDSKDDHSEDDDFKDDPSDDDPSEGK